ncbi:MAG: four helix bundle protein [Deltaproteobacteria bacterium]|nr:four helix bundle protein [Deltaproteobacteria bacterium]
MAQYEHLPIYKKAFDMTIYIENIVKGFSRYHKYTLGTDLRNLSREVVRLIIKANSERDRLSTLQSLRDTIEGLKITVRICKEVKALKNFNSFNHLISEVISLGRQSEGWLKSMRGKE